MMAVRTRVNDILLLVELSRCACAIGGSVGCHLVVGIRLDEEVRVSKRENNVNNPKFYAFTENSTDSYISSTPPRVDLSPMPHGMGHDDRVARLPQVGSGHGGIDNGTMATESTDW